MTLGIPNMWLYILLPDGGILFILYALRTFYIFDKIAGAPAIGNSSFGN